MAEATASRIVLDRVVEELNGRADPPELLRVKVGELFSSRRCGGSLLPSHAPSSHERSSA